MKPSHDFLERMDKDAAVKREQSAYFEAIQARSFDPRRAAIIAAFDSMGDSAKSVLHEVAIELAK
jgi:hypothetical protein